MGRSFDKEFQALFEGMTLEDPRKRFSLREIKKAAWYNQEIYSDEELKDIMGTKYWVII